MKILLLSTSDSRGGAPIAAQRLLEGLKGIGVDAIMMVGRKFTDNPHVIAPKTAIGKAWYWMLPRLDDIPCKLRKTKFSRFASSNWLPNNIVSRVNDFMPDVINLHFVGTSFIRLGAFK